MKPVAGQLLIVDPFELAIVKKEIAGDANAQGALRTGLPDIWTAVGSSLDGWFGRVSAWSDTSRSGDSEQDPHMIPGIYIPCTEQV